jgi:hypothetical protein
MLSRVPGLMLEKRDTIQRIRRVQELLGHNDAKTMIIFNHALNRGPGRVKNPLDLTQ